MCGIAAVFNTTGRADKLDLDRIAHRGPDGRGEWISPDGRIWLGHTRLAILDLSPAGAQPMHDEETGNVIIFNGEIYNHLKLRAEMKEAGVKWKGTSDTETLLAAYRVWGEGFTDRLRGMFAFIIFDKAKNRLFAGRGAAGIKPFYYGRFGDSLRFGSEVRLLMGNSPRKCSRSSLSSYLQWGSCPENDFIFSGISMVPAGSNMIVESDGTVTFRRYWPSARYRHISADAAPLEVRKLIERSVEEHLLSDVPVACFLSGGIDSSIITAVAARALRKGRLCTFAVGFPHREFDETSVAEEVAQRYGTDHRRIEVTDEEAIVLVKEAVDKMDAPSVDAINTYIVSRKVAQQGIKVALSGLGADELFGGYPSFRDTGWLRLLSAIPKSIRAQFSGMGALGARIADIPAGDLTAMAIWRRRLWTDGMLREAGLDATPLHIEVPPELPDNFSRISWAELTVYTRQMLLRDSDQMSMASSLELRVPFLDRDLMEYVLSLHTREKTRYSGVKGLLVQACRDLLPTSVYNRPKMGFSLPMDAWMRGPLKEFSSDGLGQIEHLGLIPPAAIARLRAQFTEGKMHWTRIWSLAVLGHYLKRVGAGVGFENASQRISNRCESSTRYVP